MRGALVIALVSLPVAWAAAIHAPAGESWCIAWHPHGVDDETASRKFAVPVRLQPNQLHTLSLVEVGQHLGAMSRGGASALHGTIYEVVINPAINAFAYVTPRLIYQLAREIITATLTKLLEESLLPVLTDPVMSALDPAGPAAVFLTTGGTASAADFTNPHELEALPRKLHDLLSDAVMQQLRPVVTDKVVERLAPRAANAVARAILRHTAARLIPALTRPIVYNTTAQLGQPNSVFVQRMARSLSDTLTVPLTRALSSAVAAALTSDPEAGWACHYCHEKGLYCKLCSSHFDRQTQVLAQVGERAAFQAWSVSSACRTSGLCDWRPS